LKKYISRIFVPLITPMYKRGRWSFYAATFQFLSNLNKYWDSNPRSSVLEADAMSTRLGICRYTFYLWMTVSTHVEMFLRKISNVGETLHYKVYICTKQHKSTLYIPMYDHVLQKIQHKE
jgi:hypothetical protein